MNRVQAAYARAGHDVTGKQWLPDYYLGLDLGQASDPTALAIIQVDKYSNGLEIPLSQRVCKLVRLDRVPLRTSYPDIVRDVHVIMRDLKATACEVYLIVDATGVGRPVVDMFELEGLDPFALTYTAGHDVTKGDKPREFNVPKRDLVSAVKVALQKNLLRIAAGNPLTDVLINELKQFKVKINLKGHDSYEAWRGSDHDDLVLATAMAVWASKWEGICANSPTWGPSPDSFYRR